MACEACRVRKSKCDGQQPRCSNCTKAGRNECVYVAPRKRGPNKKSIRKLEERLAILEKAASASAQQQLNRQDSTLQQPLSPPQSCPSQPSPGNVFGTSDSTTPVTFDDSPFADGPVQDPNLFLTDNFDTFFDFIGPGLGVGNFENALPPPDSTGCPASIPTAQMAQELQDLFFEKVNFEFASVHPGRFLRGNPPLCLRYTVWALGALCSPQHRACATSYYLAARAQLEADELKGSGESCLTLGHAQSWGLIAFFESMHHAFIRCWMSSRRSIALCQMLCLDRLDGTDSTRWKLLPEPADYAEKEERRRTFWLAFGMDRWAGGGYGWAVSIDVKEVATNLPGPYEAFLSGTEAPSRTLVDTVANGFDCNTHLHAAQVINNYLIGRILTLFHRSPDGRTREEDELMTWNDYRSIERILSKLFMTLPARLVPANNIGNPAVLHANMMMHACTISLMHSTLGRLSKSNLDPEVPKSFVRLAYIAAEAIISVVRMTVHLPAEEIHPFGACPIYMATRTFLHSDDEAWGSQRSRANVDFAMAAVYRLAQSHNVVHQVFVKMREDVSQSRFADLVVDKYKTAKPRPGDGAWNTNMDKIPELETTRPTPGIMPW